MRRRCHHRCLNIPEVLPGLSSREITRTTLHEKGSDLGQTPARKVALIHMLEAWQLDQERRGSVAPGGALAASKMVAVAFWGSSAAILRSVSKEQEGLCLEPPTSPEASEPQSLAVPCLCP